MLLMLKDGDFKLIRVSPEKLNGYGAIIIFEAEEYEVPVTKPIIENNELSPSVKVKFAFDVIVKIFVLLLYDILVFGMRVLNCVMKLCTL